MSVAAAAATPASLLAAFATLNTKTTRDKALHICPDSKNRKDAQEGLGCGLVGIASFNPYDIPKLQNPGTLQRLKHASGLDPEPHDRLQASNGFFARSQEVLPGNPAGYKYHGFRALPRYVFIWKLPV